MDTRARPDRRDRDRQLVVVVSEPGEADDRIRSALIATGLDVKCLRERDLVTSQPLARPAVVVLDDARGRQERLDAQLRLRSHPLLKAVPLVVLSEDCGIDSFGGAIARGASAFLPKPVDRAELQDVARRLAAWREPGTRPEATRRGPRRPLLMAVDVDVAGGVARRGRIVDASATGCRLELPESVSTGATVGIVPRSCVDSTEIRLGGTVRWSRPAASGHSVAVRWTGTSTLLARRILGLEAEA